MDFEIQAERPKLVASASARGAAVAVALQCQFAVATAFVGPVRRTVFALVAIAVGRVVARVDHERKPGLLALLANSFGHQTTIIACPAAVAPELNGGGCARLPLVSALSRDLVERLSEVDHSEPHASHEL